MPLAPLLADARPGVRVVVVSDFLGDEAEVRSAGRALMAGHCDLHAVHVVAAEELDPPTRPIRAVDPESDRIARPFDETMRTAYDARFAEWRRDTATAWRHAGATWTTVSTADDPALAVRRIIGASSGASVVEAAGR